MSSGARGINLIQKGSHQSIAASRKQNDDQLKLEKSTINHKINNHKPYISFYRYQNIFFYNYLIIQNINITCNSTISCV